MNKLNYTQMESMIGSFDYEGKFMIAIIISNENLLTKFIIIKFWLNECDYTTNVVWNPPIENNWKLTEFKVASFSKVLLIYNFDFLVNEMAQL
jgi:hypothetical protein